MKIGLRAACENPSRRASRAGEESGKLAVRMFSRLVFSRRFVPFPSKSMYWPIQILQRECTERVFHAFRALRLRRETQVFAVHSRRFASIPSNNVRE